MIAIRGDIKVHYHRPYFPQGGQVTQLMTNSIILQNYSDWALSLIIGYPNKVVQLAFVTCHESFKNRFRMFLCAALIIPRPIFESPFIVNN